MNVRTATARVRSAFTLVELLVVIGIIAVLVGILLPTLNSARTKGRDVACQANLRSIMQMTIMYAGEYKGSFPYALYYTPRNLASWAPASQTDTTQGTFVSWQTVLDKYARKRARDDNRYTIENTTRGDDGSNVFKCPTAAGVYGDDQALFQSYVCNPNLMPDPATDYRVGTQFFMRRPAKISDLKKVAIVYYDTSLLDETNTVGYVSGVDLDDQNFWRGALSLNHNQYRFYPPGRLFTTGSAFQPGSPLDLGTTQDGTNWENVDGRESFPYQGNLRFRHGKNNTVHVVFSDGHVEARIGASRGRDTNGDPLPWKHDFIRREFMAPLSTAVGRIKN